jgi:hypothetical protein
VEIAMAKSIVVFALAATLFLPKPLWAHCGQHNGQHHSDHCRDHHQHDANCCCKDCKNAKEAKSQTPSQPSGKQGGTDKKN